MYQPPPRYSPRLRPRRSSAPADPVGGRRAGRCSGAVLGDRSDAKDGSARTAFPRRSRLVRHRTVKTLACTGAKRRRLPDTVRRMAAVETITKVADCSTGKPYHVGFTVRRRRYRPRRLRTEADSARGTWPGSATGPAWPTGSVCRLRAAILRQEAGNPAWTVHEISISRSTYTRRDEDAAEPTLVADRIPTCRRSRAQRPASC
jgi:hypothetical protein